MPKDVNFYVNGTNDTLEGARKRMKSYNRRYMRDMGTLVKAEKGLLSRDNLNKFTNKELKDMVLQRIKKNNLADPSKGGKLAIKCKDGKVRYYKPNFWSTTIARTRSRALQEEGLHNRMKSIGFDLVMVSIGGSGDACTNWEGQILSITGETPGYPTVDEAQGSGEVFHPNCVHSTSPVVITEGENGPRIWGRDGLPPKAATQIKAAGLTKKGVVRNGLNVDILNPPKKPVNMQTPQAINTITKAVKASKVFAVTAGFVGAMAIDGIQDATQSMQDANDRFPTDKLDYFGSNQKAPTELKADLSGAGASYTSKGGKKAVVFNTPFTKPKVVIKESRKLSKELTDDKGIYNQSDLTGKGVSPTVIKRLNIRHMERHVDIIKEKYGIKGTIYQEYGKLIRTSTDYAKSVTIANEAYTQGWGYILGESSVKSKINFYTSSYAAYMLGQKHLVAPKLWAEFKDIDKGL